MATPSAADLRNFTTVGHASSGKTTLSEAMLACAGVIGRMGNIAQGNTVSDYHVSEKQHQISTQTSLLHCTWMGKKLNILDTPGYLDFMSEALAAVHVADFALVVVHAQHGNGVGTERVGKCARDWCTAPPWLLWWGTRNTASAWARSGCGIAQRTAASRRSSWSTPWTNRTRTSTKCWPTRAHITDRKFFLSTCRSIRCKTSTTRAPHCATKS